MQCPSSSHRRARTSSRRAGLAYSTNQKQTRFPPFKPLLFKNHFANCFHSFFPIRTRNCQVRGERRTVAHAQRFQCQQCATRVSIALLILQNQKHNPQSFSQQNLGQSQRESRRQLHVLELCHSLNQTGKRFRSRSRNTQRQTTRANRLQKTAGAGRAQHKTTRASVLFHCATKRMLRPFAQRVHFQQHNHLHNLNTCFFPTLALTLNGTVESSGTEAAISLMTS